MRFQYLLVAFALFLAACSSNSEQDLSSVLEEQDLLSSASGDQAQFLLSNASDENVVVTESGLQYEILREGDGSMPGPNDVVTVHYVGTFTDGVEFDSSYARGEPNTFILAGTILGWLEGVQLMNVGSQYRFVIPPELAYGDQGAGTAIPPGAVLIFVVELLEVNSA